MKGACMQIVTPRTLRQPGWLSSTHASPTPLRKSPTKPFTFPWNLVKALHFAHKRLCFFATLPMSAIVTGEASHLAHMQVDDWYHVQRSQAEGRDYDFLRTWRCRACVHGADSSVVDCAWPAHHVFSSIKPVAFWTNQGERLCPNRSERCDIAKGSASWALWRRREESSRRA